MAVPSRRRGKTKVVARSVFLVVHAPDQPLEGWQWCDVCDTWTPNTVRTMPVVRRGAVLQPTRRVCLSCWEGSVEEWDALVLKERCLESWLGVEEVEAAHNALIVKLKEQVTFEGFRKGMISERELTRRFGKKIARQTREDALLMVYKRDADQPE